VGAGVSALACEPPGVPGHLSSFVYASHLVVAADPGSTLEGVEDVPDNAPCDEQDESETLADCDALNEPTGPPTFNHRPAILQNVIEGGAPDFAGYEKHHRLKPAAIRTASRIAPFATSTQECLETSSHSD